LGWGAPDARPWTADYAEALLEIGRIDDAVRVIDLWEADATRLARERVLAHVTRCRGLVSAARGAVAEAASSLDQAAARHEEVGDAFGRARALLALGIVLRRTRQKRPAREAIHDALGGFEQLGAATWVEKARAELGRIGGRKRAEGLTAAERRVAVLVAAGLTNREVARERRARSAAEERTEGTTRVRFERSIHVPEDEICFFVFDAPSGRDAALAAQRAELDPIRVVEAVSSRKESA